MFVMSKGGYKLEDVKFDIFIPMDIEGSVRKSDQEGKGKEWYVRGYASTPDLDLQGDIVQPAGIDIEYFKKHGWINYEHKQDAEYAIGVPTDACYIDFERGLFVEAKLLQHNKYAKDIWDLAKNIKKSGINRQLGFSIEGGIRKRNDRDNRIIEELVIRNVAITKSPANPKATWDMFMKSWTTGHETDPGAQVNGSALRREHLAQAITNLSYTYKIGNPTEYNELWTQTSEYLDESGRNSKEASIIMLQLSRGLSRKDAEAFITELESKGGTNL